MKTKLKAGIPECRNSGIPAFRAFGTRTLAQLLALFACLSSLHAATAVRAPSSGLQQSFTSDNIKGTFVIPGETVPRFGFIPVRVTVDNRQARDFRWQSEFVVNSFSNSGFSTTARSVLPLNVSAGRSDERWLFVPTAEAGLNRQGGGYYSTWGNLGVTVDGPGIREQRLNFGSGGRGSNQMIPWAVSSSLESAVRSHLVALKTDPRPPTTSARGRTYAAPGPRPLINGSPNLYVFDPVQPLADWRAWSPFARVIMRVDEYATLPPANRTALRNWVALGGVLHLAPDVPLRAERQNLGAGTIVTLRQAIASDETHDSDGLFTGEGIFISTSAIPSDLSLQKGGLADKISPAKRVGDWLVYFFIGFAVLVAPVNLFAIAPVKRRHWLFLSVPAISLVAVVVLMAAIYLQDGIGGEGARRALVVLLPGDNQAAVFQEQVSRTGLLLGSGFPLKDDIICAAVAADDSNIQPGRALEYNRNNDRASGDWFRGRARQAQHLRRLTPTRARVEQVGQAPDGAPIVQSSVGTTLRDFCYIDSRQQAWGAAQLPLGAPVTLKRILNVPMLRDRAIEFGQLGSVHFRELARSSVDGPPQGRFIALADPSELAPLPTLESIHWKDSSVMFTGVVEGAAAVEKAAP